MVKSVPRIARVSVRAIGSREAACRSLSPASRSSASVIGNGKSQGWSAVGPFRTIDHSRRSSRLVYFGTLPARRACTRWSPDCRCPTLDI
jgi:hypothetical protein